MTADAFFLGCRMAQRPRAAPDKFLTLLQKGIGLQQQRRFAEAEYCYQTVLRDNPRHPDALNLLSTLAIEAKRPDEAIKLSERALRELPKQPLYLNNLGSAHLLARNLVAAEAALQRALRLAPNLVDALCNLGRVNKLLNRSEQALAYYEQALERAPDSSKAQLGLADVLVDLGDSARAVPLYRRLIADGRDVVAALIGLAAAHRFEPADPEPELIEAALVQGQQDLERRNALLHAAGKARADLQQYDTAFAHFAAGKALSGATFNLGLQQERYAALTATLNEAFFAERQGFGVVSEVPIFIVGMPRSGTTLTEQICSSHPEVSGAGELTAIGDLARQLGAQDADPGRYAAQLTSMSAGQSRDLAKRYLEQLRHFGGNAMRITDKMPHNFEHLGLIRLLFPKARIIHCVRDSIDTCVSCFTHHFSVAHGYNTDLAVLGRYYRAYEGLMAHWWKGLPGAIHENSYEALVREQELRSRALIAYLGLEWDPACLDFHNNERLVKTLSKWQVRQPLYATSVAAWKRYEQHLAPLFAALGVER